MTQNPRHVVIADEEHALPYSKGLMASSIMATGLAPARAFHVAERIEERLHQGGMAEITRAALSELARQVLVEEVPGTVDGSGDSLGCVVLFGEGAGVTPEAPGGCSPAELGGGP